jgi:hypothetical protein
MKKIAQVCHSDTFRSLVIALLIVSAAILLSACAGGTGGYLGTGE